jgi:hypothetical protein
MIRVAARQQRVASDPGVVHKNIESLVLGLDCLEHLLDGTSIRHVAGHGNSLTTSSMDRSDGLFKFGRVPSHTQYVRTVLSKPYRNGLPEPLRGARNHRYLALQIRGKSQWRGHMQNSCVERKIGSV